MRTVGGGGGCPCRAGEAPGSRGPLSWILKDNQDVDGKKKKKKQRRKEMPDRGNGVC